MWRSLTCALLYHVHNQLKVTEILNKIKRYISQKKTIQRFKNNGEKNINKRWRKSCRGGGDYRLKDWQFAKHCHLLSNSILRRPPLSPSLRYERFSNGQCRWVFLWGAMCQGKHFVFHRQRNKSLVLSFWRDKFRAWECVVGSIAVLLSVPIQWQKEPDKSGHWIIWCISSDKLRTCDESESGLSVPLVRLDDVVLWKLHQCVVPSHHLENLLRSENKLREINGAFSGGQMLPVAGGNHCSKNTSSPCVLVKLPSADARHLAKIFSLAERKFVFFSTIFLSLLKLTVTFSLCTAVTAALSLWSGWKLYQIQIGAGKTFVLPCCQTEKLFILAVYPPTSVAVRKPRVNLLIKWEERFGWTRKRKHLQTQKCWGLRGVHIDVTRAGECSLSLCGTRAESVPVCNFLYHSRCFHWFCKDMRVLWL